MIPCIVTQNSGYYRNGDQFKRSSFLLIKKGTSDSLSFDCLYYTKLYIYINDIMWNMKNMTYDKINLLNLDVRFEDFCSGLTRILFVFSIISIICASLFSNGNNGVGKQSGLEGGSTIISPFREIGPGGCGGSRSSTVTYYGGLSFSQSLYANPIYSLVGTNVQEYLTFKISQKVFESRAPDGQTIIHLSPVKNSTNIGVSPDIFLYCQPYSYGVFKEINGIVHDPESLNCYGCEFVWSPSFSVSQSFVGTPKITYNFLLEVIIQHDGANVKIYGWESINGKVDINWAEIVMGLISIPIPS